MATRDPQAVGPEYFGRSIQQAMSMSQLLSLAAPQLRQLWLTQDRILNEFEQFAQAWCERRHEANHAAIEAANTIAAANGDGDPSYGMRLLGDWMNQSMMRLSEDAREGSEFCLRCASHIASGSVAAGAPDLAEEPQQAKHAAKTGAKKGG